MLNIHISFKTSCSKYHFLSHINLAMAVTVSNLNLFYPTTMSTFTLILKIKQKKCISFQIRPFHEWHYCWKGHCGYPCLQSHILGGAQLKYNNKNQNCLFSRKFYSWLIFSFCQSQIHDFVHMKIKSWNVTNSYCNN